MVGKPANNESWTKRYTPLRCATAPLDLRPPLSHAWTYTPDETGSGVVCTGDDSVFTTLGTWKPTSLSLDTGAVLWSTDTKDETSYLGRWHSELLAGGETLCGLDWATGVIRWSRERQVGLGDSFVVGDTIVGSTADAWSAVDLSTDDVRWSKPEYVSNALVSDGNVVVAPDEIVRCVDFLTGELRWRCDAARFGGRPDDPSCLWNGRLLGEFGGRITAVDIMSGESVWSSDVPKRFLWYPYRGHVYRIYSDHTYSVHSIEDGTLAHQGRIHGRSFFGLTDYRLVAGESHLFVAEGTGHLCSIDIKTGRVDQVVEIPGEPRGEPVIYRNHLLITTFDSELHCFRGAD